MAGFQYFPHTDEDIRAMLDRIGVNSLDDLYADVPADCLYQGEYDLPDAMTEQQVRDFFEGLAAKNPKLKVAKVHIRVPEHDLHPDRNGRKQRLHV